MIIHNKPSAVHRLKEIVDMHVNGSIMLLIHVDNYRYDICIVRKKILHTKDFAGQVTHYLRTNRKNFANKGIAMIMSMNIVNITVSFKIYQKTQAFAMKLRHRIVPRTQQVQLATQPLQIILAKL